MLIGLNQVSEGVIDDISRFLEAHRDEVAALRILYRPPAASRRLIYASLKELRDAMLRPPWLAPTA